MLTQFAKEFIDNFVINKLGGRKILRRYLMNIERCTGIYGIYVNDELVYIGKTLNSFAKRFDNHNYYMRHSDKGSKMYKITYCMHKYTFC